jgi:RNA polymerase sigma-70 factor (ECF subfamily)
MDTAIARRRGASTATSREGTNMQHRNTQIAEAHSPSSQANRADDAALVQRILAGDEQGFELLMRRYNQLLFRAARAIVGNAADAEDVVQEAYLSAFRALSRFEGRSRLATWLVRIVVNEARTRARRNSRIVPLESVTSGGDAVPNAASARAAGWLGSSTRGPEDALGDRQLRTTLSDAVDRLPEPLRTVFVLRCVEGMDGTQTADCLQLSDEAVRVRLHRARAALRAHIDETLGEESRRLFSFGNQRCDRIVALVISRLPRVTA